MAPHHTGNARALSLCTDMMDLRDEMQALTSRVSGLDQHISNVFSSVHNVDTTAEIVAEAKSMMDIRKRMAKGNINVTHIDAAIGALFHARAYFSAPQSLGGFPDTSSSKRKRTDEDSNLATRASKKNVKHSPHKCAFLSQEVQKPFSLNITAASFARKHYTTQRSSASNLEVRMEEDSYKLVIYKGGKSLATSDANCQVYPNLVRRILFANTGLKIRLEFKDCQYGDANLDRQMDLEMSTKEDRNAMLRYFSAWGFRTAMAKDDKYMDTIFAAKHRMRTKPSAPH